MNVKILEAKIQNKKEVCKIYQEFINETHASQPEDLEKNFELFIAQDCNHITLILFDDNLAGFIEYQDLPKKLRYSKQKVEISALFVKAQFRKSGLGKELINHVKNYAKKADRDRIVLASSMELIEAHKFYEKIGFEKKGFFFEMKLS